MADKQTCACGWILPCDIEIGAMGTGTKIAAVFIAFQCPMCGARYGQEIKEGPTAEIAARVSLHSKPD